jgi:hypothetical protein
LSSQLLFLLRCLCLCLRLSTLYRTSDSNLGCHPIMQPTPIGVYVLRNGQIAGQGVPEDMGIVKCMEVNDIDVVI